MMVKVCSKCGEEKLISEFHKDKSRKDGLSDWCKNCKKEIAKQQRKENKIRHTDEYYQSITGTKICSDCKKEKNFKEFYIDRSSLDGFDSLCKNCVKNYYQDNIERELERGKIWKENNRDKVNKYENERRKKKLEKDEQYKLRYQIHFRLNNLIKRNLRKGISVKEIGLEGKELKKYIKNQFQNGMSWDNYGIIWEMDHIIPLYTFNLLDKQQYLKACHYTNLRPMWVSINRAWNNKYK